MFFLEGGLGDRALLSSRVLGKIDPRLKIIFFVAFSSILALTGKVSVVALGLFFSGVLFLLSSVDKKGFFRALATAMGFALFVSVTLPFTVHGRVIYTLGPLAMSREGLAFGAFIFAKSSAIVMLMLLLLSTSSPLSLIHALHHLRVPDKMVQLLFFTFRYIQVVRREYAKLSSAVKLRCFRPGTNFHSYRTYAYLVGVLLVRSYDRATRVYKAMLARGFRGKFPVLHHFRLEKVDLAFSAAASLFLVAMVAVSVV